MIVEEEQGGKARAEYGRGSLKELSKYLTSRFGRGFSETNLGNARQFYQTYSLSIPQLLTGESCGTPEKQIPRLLTGESEKGHLTKGQTLLDVFKISRTHYIVLIRIKNEDERRFYDRDDK
ncbi:MAG: DUF1016 N-terminal domain-containing protein [Methanomassiliicoccaceae archaeon]|nr:DUF1016 N-terminal domain-containing protein [Methanomassiliicoccaceae archaeon]